MWPCASSFGGSLRFLLASMIIERPDHRQGAWPRHSRAVPAATGELKREARCKSMHGACSGAQSARMALGAGGSPKMLEQPRPTRYAVVPASDSGGIFRAARTKNKKRYLERSSACAG